MAQQPNHENDDLLAADADDPQLSVHGLSEFAFCPRAGLCLYEQDFEEDEREVKADLYFPPIHEPQKLALVLETVMRQFIWTLFGGLGTFGLLVVAAWYLEWLGLWAAAAATLLVTARRLYDRGYWGYTIQRQLELWQQVTPRMPDAESPKIQEVDWRDLIASEASPLTPQAAYPAPTWKLGGKPWRLLEYEDLRIPVFKHGGDWNGLFRQHFVRMAALCRLVEMNEGCRCPYGVIVKGPATYAAVTIPNTARTQTAFQEALLSARQTIRDAEELNIFPAKPDPSTCSKCRFGAPVRLHRRKRFLRHGASIDPKVAKDPKKKKYHSHCGDRFRWMPPHRDAEAMELSEE